MLSSIIVMIRGRFKSRKYHSPNMFQNPKTMTNEDEERVGAEQCESGPVRKVLIKI